MSNANPPKGFRDLLPDDFSAREYLKKIISDTYEQFGYQPIDTPVVENVEVLQGKGGGENEKLMFKVLKRGRKLTKAIAGETWNELADMGLRFDLTVPLARFVSANQAEISTVFKRYQIAPVWRADRPQHGRFREFVQCDVDIIGSSSMMAEADVLSASTTCLAKLGFKNMQLHINSRPLVPMIVRKAGVPENLVENGLRALDKIDRFGIEGAVKEMKSAGTAEESCDRIKTLFDNVEKLDNQGRLKAVADFCGADASEYVMQISQLLEMCPDLDATQLIMDPFLVRGMDYYTGPIFEIRLADAGFSIAGGGRYDKLISTFNPNLDLPATGFSIGFERILVIMKEKGMIPEGQGGLDVVICSGSDGIEKKMLELANELRRGGLKVDVSLLEGKIGKIMQEAEKRRARFGLIIKDSDKVEIRELATRQGEEVELKEAAKKLLGKFVKKDEYIVND